MKQRFLGPRLFDPRERAWTQHCFFFPFLKRWNSNVCIHERHLSVTTSANMKNISITCWLVHDDSVFLSTEFSLMNKSFFNWPVPSAERLSLSAAVWRYAATAQPPSCAPPYSSSSSPCRPGEKTVREINKMLQMQRRGYETRILFPLSCRTLASDKNETTQRPKCFYELDALFYLDLSIKW